jgi:signal transduction histidine kinase
MVSIALEFLLVFILLLVVINSFIFFSRKKKYEKEIEKRDFEIKIQKNSLQAIILTQEEERERIAQDLHDEISSKLNLVSLNLYSLKSPKKTELQRLEIIDTIIQVNNSAIENSRRIAHNLMPPILEKFGLNQALIELIMDFENTKLVSINYRNDIDFNAAGFDVQLQLFRIIQELINNSLKHGKASEIKIEFVFENTINKCTYKDNGLGFDVSSLEESKGLGMQNIENRIELLDGNFSFDSEFGKGIVFAFSFVMK